MSLRVDAMRKTPKASGVLGSTALSLQLVLQPAISEVVSFVTPMQNRLDFTSFTTVTSPTQTNCLCHFRVST